MSKILGSWGSMKKFLEKEMLCEALQGRISYNCTTYPNMDGCKIFEIRIDGKCVKQFSFETVNSYFINNGFAENKKPIGKKEYWNEFSSLLEKTPITLRQEYTDEEFCSALCIYRNQNIQESIVSDNPIIQMFAVLDRRIGKRTLINIKDLINTNPQWLQNIYSLRLNAENL